VYLMIYGGSTIQF